MYVALLVRNYLHWNHLEPYVSMNNSNWMQKPLGIRSAEQDEGGNSHVGMGGACDGSAELLPLES